MARSYDNGGRTSRHLRRHARCSMPRPPGSAQHHRWGNDPPQFARAGQNIAAAAMLLRGLLEPVDPQEQMVHRNLRALVETAAVQQAESSAS